MDHPQGDETGLREGSGGGRRARDRGDGRRWWVLFYTLIYCRRYFLVGASWRLPHHRTRQWWPLDILFRIIARLAGPFYASLRRTTPLRSAFFPDSSLLSRKLCANRAQYPLRIPRLSAPRGFNVSRGRTEGFDDVADMLDTRALLSTLVSAGEIREITPIAVPSGIARVRKRRRGTEHMS